MAIEKIRFYGTPAPVIIWDAEAPSYAPERLGEVQVEIINGNVIITVERRDESKFGPVSLVVV